MIMKKPKAVIIHRSNSLGVALALLAVAGCKTKPAPDSGYLAESYKMTEQRDRFPFQRVWVKPGISKDHYNAIVIGPVNTHYLMENTGWKAANPGNLRLEESAQNLAEYTQKTFIKAFTEDKTHRFMVTTQPQKGALALDIAIVELVPSKAVLSAVSIVAPPQVGIPAGVAAGKSSVAIEGRVRDPMNGEVLMMFADREEPPQRIIDLKSVTWWEHAKDSIDLWAKQMVKLANTPPDEKVKDEPFFRLRPW
ncbi:MAG: DUF3313 domain-containing protein [Gemmataceae bacterium]|nr:DUF3313 domain-containing protein [Gemmataceae bacterium]